MSIIQTFLMESRPSPDPIRQAGRAAGREVAHLKQTGNIRKANEIIRDMRRKKQEVRAQRSQPGRFEKTTGQDQLKQKQIDKKINRRVGTGAGLAGAATLAGLVSYRYRMPQKIGNAISRFRNRRYNRNNEEERYY